MYTCTGLTCHPPLYKAHLPLVLTFVCGSLCPSLQSPHYKCCVVSESTGVKAAAETQTGWSCPQTAWGRLDSAASPSAISGAPSVGRTGIPWSPPTQPHARGMSSPGTPPLPGSAAAEEDCVCPIFSSSKPGYTCLPQMMFLFEQLSSAREKLRCKSVGFIAFSNCRK